MSKLNDFLTQQAAYYNGILNVPQEAVRYAGLGANWVFNKLGLRNDQQAAMASGQIKEFMDNPPVLPQQVNAYRNWLAQQQPEMNTTGNIVGSAFVGSPIYKNMATYLDKVPVMVKSGYSFNPSVASTTGAVAGESFLEPYLDKR